MKSNYKIIILLALMPISCISQNWSCINGEKNQASLGNYEKRYKSSSKNIVSARQMSSGCVINENYYLFGGQGFNQYGKKVPLNDFWKFDIIEGKWSWISGDTGRFFLQKWNSKNHNIDFDASPSPRASACSWSFENKFYVFGGYGFDQDGKYVLNNQIWSFDLNKNYWTWIKGDTNSNSIGYTLHQGCTNDLLVTPSARCNMSTWSVNDRFYLLGGYGWNENNKLTKLSDFWCYHIKTNRWEQLAKDSSIYIAEIENFQSTKSDYPYFISDASTFVIDNALFIYGGYPYYENGMYEISGDMRKYDIVTKTWSKYSMESYKEFALEKSRYNLSHPGVRSNSISWVYHNKMYLYGGNTNDSKGELGRINDLWSYDILSNKWERLNGDQLNYNGSSSHFESVNNYDELNTPGARINAASFVYRNELYLFGGFVSTENAAGLFNDLWKFNIPIVTQNNNTINPPPLLNTGYSSQQNISQDNNYEGGNAKATIVKSDDICFSPNPVLNEAVIFSVNKKGTSVYKIINSNGTEFLHGQLNEMLSNKKYTLDLSALPSGNYFFKLTAASQSTTIYFSKQ